MHYPKEKDMEHGYDPNAPTYDNVTLRREGDELVIDLDGQVSTLPHGWASAYFAPDGRVAVRVYAYLYAREANLIGEGVIES